MHDSLVTILQHTFPDREWWDALRYISAVATAILILGNLRVAFGTDRPGEDRDVKTIRIGVCSNMCAALPLCLTEISSLGQPIVPWRLPLVLAMDVLGLWYLHRRL